MRFSSIASTGVLPALALGANFWHDLDKRQDASNTVTVDLSTQQGAPKHLASGFLYGIPDTPNLVPSHFYTDMGFRYTRAGGSQLPAPSRGWVYGPTEFQNRFNSALSNYRSAREYKAGFILLVSDIWGADGTQGIAMPGDNGNWTSYDNFLHAIISNIQKHRMIRGLQFEIWNEPDFGSVFWQRDQQQFLEMWGRGFYRMKKAFPNLPIIGPCTAFAPSSTNTWLQQFYNFVKPNNSIPDTYCWHEEIAGDDLQVDVAYQRQMEKDLGLPANPIILDEYGLENEQQPACTSWFISRFERANVLGLRGNWFSSYSLHDYFAGLIGKPGANFYEDATEGATAGYWPNGEYQVYKYYSLNMTGQRVATTGSGDAGFDCYATSTSLSSGVKVLCGSRLTSGTYFVQINNFTAVGLPSEGNIDIHTYHFEYTNGVFGNVQAPQDQGLATHSYYGNTLVFGVNAQNTTGYAFELVPN